MLKQDSIVTANDCSSTTGYVHLWLSAQGHPELPLLRGLLIVGNQLSDHWDLSDPAAQTLLEELLDCFDRLQGHKAVLAKGGAICRDRFGQEKLFPAFLSVRDETVTFSRLLKALNLEFENQDNRPGRPDGFMPETNDDM